MIGKNVYEPRYCAYVDILGFSDLINELRGGSLSYEELRDLLTTIHQPENVSTKSWYTEFRAQSISDAVAISTLVSPVGLIEILRALEILTMKLLAKGYFVRGALVKGNLYHDDKMVFGEALVRAYKLESEVVRYPRIMATRDIHLDIENYLSAEENTSFVNRLLQADDGPMFVHTLRTVAALVHQTHIDNLSKPPAEQVQLTLYRDVQRVIQRRFDESIDNPRHFEKVQWFAKYWNASLPFGVMDFKNITGPGLIERIGLVAE